MAVIKYKDPVTGEVKKVGTPYDYDDIRKETDTKIAESEVRTDEKLSNKAPAYSYGTTDMTPGVSALETGKLYFVYE